MILSYLACHAHLFDQSCYKKTASCVSHLRYDDDQTKSVIGVLKEFVESKGSFAVVGGSYEPWSKLLTS